MPMRAGAAVAIAVLGGCNAVFGLDPTQLAADDDGGTDGVDAQGVDAVPCKDPGTHDEDGDGRTDACDICPHVADSGQDDGDGDQVGDACDPGPGPDRIVHFDPLEPAGTDWNIVYGNWFNDPAGFKVVDGTDALAYTTVALSEGGTVDVGIRLDDVSNSTGGAVSLWYRAALQTPPAQGYACRIANDGAGGSALDLSVNTGTQSFPQGSQPMGTPYAAAQRLRLRGYHEWNGGGLRCDGYQPPAEAHLVSRNTMFSAGQIGVGAAGNAITIEYIVVFAIGETD